MFISKERWLKLVSRVEDLEINKKALQNELTERIVRLRHDHVLLLEHLHLMVRGDKIESRPVEADYCKRCSKLVTLTELKVNNNICEDCNKEYKSGKS